MELPVPTVNLDPSNALPLCLNVPVRFISPLTSNLKPGLVVPIPTKGVDKLV